MPPSETDVEAAPGEQIGLVVEADPDRLARLVSAEDRLSQQQVDGSLPC